MAHNADRPSNTAPITAKLEIGPTRKALQQSFDSVPESESDVYVNFVLEVSGFMDGFTVPAQVNGLSYSDYLGMYLDVTAEIHGDFLLRYPELKALAQFRIAEYDYTRGECYNGDAAVRSVRPRWSDER